MLQIKHIFKKYRSKKILNDVSLTVNPGEIALLIGSSGVGKSTLLRILNNLESYDSGTIELNGNIIDIKDSNKSHKFGMVFQQFNLFENMTTLENITFPLEKVLKKTPEEAQNIAQILLQQYGLEERAQVYPRQLSGGQKQRLAIARTLAMQPEVLCLDEPTSALDPLLTNYVAQAIQDLASKGYMVLVATHDTGLIERIQGTIYFMQQGVIAESSLTQEFFADKTRFPKINSFMQGSIAQ